MNDLPSATAPQTSPLNRSISVPDLSVPKSVELPDHLYNDGHFVQKWLSNVDQKTPTGPLPETSHLPAFSPTPIRAPHSPPHHPRVSAIIHGMSPPVVNNSGNGRMSPRTFSKTRLGRSPAPIYTHVQDLQKMINLMFPENERLAKEIEQLKLLLSDKELTLSKLDEQLRKKDREFEELQLAKEKTDGDLETVQRERREESVRNRQLDSQIKSKTKECEQIQLELEKAIQNSTLLQSKLDLLQTDLNSSKSLVNQLTLNQTEQLKQINKLHQLEEESRQSSAGLTRRLVELQDEISQARTDYEAERHRANLNERDATSAHTQVAELQGQLAQLSARLEQMQKERSTLELQNNSLSGEKTRHVAELAEAAQTIDEQRQKLLELTSSFGKIQAEAQIAQSQMKTMESLISSQGERIQSLETARADLEKANLMLERDAKESATKREGETRSSNFQDQFAQALAAERARCEILQEKLTNMERERNHMQLEHLSQQGEAKALLDNASRDMTSLREQLIQLEQQRENQQRQMDILGTTNVELGEQLRSLTGQFDELLSQRDQLLCENTKLEEEKTESLDVARVTNQDLLDKVIAIEGACRQKEAELERERSHIASLEAHILEQQDAISHLETKIQTSVRMAHAESDLAIAEREDQITKLNQSLVAARDQVQELQERLNQTEFNLESVHSSLANSLVDFERKCNEIRDQKDRAVRENEFLRHELTSKAQHCEQLEQSYQQSRFAKQKLEDAGPLIRTLLSTTGQLGNILNASSNASSTASNVDDNRIKFTQTLERLVDLLNGVDRVQASGRSQQPIPSASMAPLPGTSGIGDRMTNNGLSRSQDYQNLSRSNTSLASSTGSNAPEGPGIVSSNMGNVQSLSNAYWQSCSQVAPPSSSQLKERFVGPITSTALPKQTIRSKIDRSRPKIEEPAHEMSELSVTDRLEELRINELQRRNQAELPHMRSSYALETLAQPLDIAQRLDPIAPKINDPNRRLNSALMRGEDDSSYCNYLMAGGGSMTNISEFSKFKPTQNLMSNPTNDESDVDHSALNLTSVPEDRTLVERQENQQSMSQLPPMGNTQFLVSAAPAIPCVPFGGLAMGGFTSYYTMPGASFATPQLHFPTSVMPTIPQSPLQTPSRKAEAFDIVFEPPKSTQKDTEFKTPQVPARLSQARASIANAADVSTSIDSASHFKIKKSGFPVMGMLQKSVTPKKKTATTEAPTAPSAGPSANKPSRGSVLGRMSFRKTAKTGTQLTQEAPQVAGSIPEQVSSENCAPLIHEKQTVSVAPSALASSSSLPLQVSSKENVPPPQ